MSVFKTGFLAAAGVVAAFLLVSVVARAVR